MDVNLLVSTLKGPDTQVGAWVNVMGYVQESRGGKGQWTGMGPVKVQAVMLWSAGGVKLGAYENAVEMRKNIGMGRGERR